jgi:ABC-type transport system involved in cytochrome c biogenesis permease subunit
MVTLHVLAAVLVIGPFGLAPFAAHRAIQRHDAERTRDAARWMARFGIGSLIVAILGMGALGFSDRFTFRSPWVIISITLYLIVMGIATGYTVPAIRRAGSMIEQGVLDRPPAAPAGDDNAPTPTLAASRTDLATKERLDSIAGRVVGSGALVLVILVVITVLMVTRPFGR